LLVGRAKHIREQPMLDRPDPIRVRERPALIVGNRHTTRKRQQDFLQRWRPALAKLTRATISASGTVSPSFVRGAAPTVAASRTTARPLVIASSTS
jgi:hypothetical protein